MSGTCVSASPANATSPMRSLRRPRMNCLTFSLATSSRFCGWKSSESIELERSMASTMLMPSLVMFSAAAPVRGRASATMSAASTRLRSAKSARAQRRPARGPCARTSAREKTIAAGRRRRRQIHQAGRTTRASSTHGEPNVRPASDITPPPRAPPRRRAPPARRARCRPRRRARPGRVPRRARS